MCVCVCVCFLLPPLPPLHSDQTETVENSFGEVFAGVISDFKGVGSINLVKY